MGYHSVVRGHNYMDYSFFFSSLRLSSFTGHTHHGQNRSYAWVTALRFGGVIPGIILFSFRLYVFHRSPVIPTTGKTVAMHWLPLRGWGIDSGDYSFFFRPYVFHHSPVIPTTGKTVAMHGLPLCDSGD